MKRHWLPICLLLFGLQSIAWGVFIVALPATAALAYGCDQVPQDLFLWQGIGLVLLLFGMGYSITTRDPVQHWLLVFVGLLAKVPGPVGR